MLLHSALKYHTTIIINNLNGGISLKELESKTGSLIQNTCKEMRFNLGLSV